MGAVYRGRDNQTGEPVAIKVLKAELAAGRPDLVERFAREGAALQALAHPNIVAVLAVARWHDQPVIVMEYAPGGSLADVLLSQPQLPIPQVLAIALDLADALTRVHRLHIIHRDIKPANV